MYQPRCLARMVLHIPGGRITGRKTLTSTVYDDKPFQNVGGLR